MASVKPEDQLSQAEIDAIGRRYVYRVVRHYMPVIIAAFALTLIVALLPTTQPTSLLGSRDNAGRLNSSSPGTVQSSATGSTPTDGGPGATGGALNTGSDATTRAGTASTGGSQITQAAFGNGVTKLGARCGPGIRQVGWTVYAPPCTGAFHGNNGGATAPGVTATTIILTYRKFNVPNAGAFSTIDPGAGLNDDQYISDLNTYINYFNSQYELYGRHVVLKPYQGQGDFVLEDQGQDLEAAQADAATAHSLGAFADVTFFATGSPAYGEALASQHIISWDVPSGDNQYYAQFSPWMYNFTEGATPWVQWASKLICQRMAGLPAVFAGDAVTQKAKRVFGLVWGDQPSWQGARKDMVAALAACHAPVAKEVTYSVGNVPQYQSQATNSIAQMRAAGVTSVICFCDGPYEIFEAQAADQQGYHPEWITFSAEFFAPSDRNIPQDQWSHAIGNAGTWPDKAHSESLPVFRAASKGDAPAEIYYYTAYATALQLFAGLQAAGPDLNPTAFQTGMFSLPPSLPGGDFGTWSFGPQAFTPVSATPVGRWDPNAIDNNDGKAGAFVSCDGGKIYPVGDPNAWGPANTQISCPSTG